MKEKPLKEAPELTKVSSKGQIVIPQKYRNKLNIKKGSFLAIMCPYKDMLVLKKIETELLKEDLQILKEIENAWNEIEKGEFKKATKEDFFKELEKW
jgi:AbrB family looped-hinge helix DNA binding protein